jgi:hypothetical protein
MAGANAKSRDMVPANAVSAAEKTVHPGIFVPGSG